MTDNAPASTRGEVRRFASADELSAAVADDFLTLAKSAIEQRGRFTVALAGGNTPRMAYQRIAEQARSMTDVAWDKVHFFFGDERVVPPDDVDSNYRMANAAILSRVAAPPGNVHRMRTEFGAERAASEYDRELRQFFAAPAGRVPRFDLILLGMGADGHTASLFPGSPALAEQERLAAANRMPNLQTARVTLTYPVLNHAANVWFVIVGADKAATLKDVLEAEKSPPFPAQLVHPTDGQLRWYVDHAAAAQL